MIDRMRPLSSLVFATAGITAILSCTGCMQNAVVTEETHYDPVSVPLDSVKHAVVHLNMSAGEMELRGGAEKLLETTLRSPYRSQSAIALAAITRAIAGIWN